MHSPDDAGSGKAHSHERPLPPEMKEKWPRVRNELLELTRRVKDIHLRANPKPLPKELSHVEKKNLVRDLLKAALMEDRPGVKRPVAQRMASAMGDYMLWSRATSCPVVHELAALTPWWVDHAVSLDVVSRLRDIALDYILNGKVIPIQKVWTDILDAPVVFLGHCVCRSSGIANDLYSPDGRVFTFTSPEENRILIDRIVGRWEALKKEHGQAPDTDGLYDKLFTKLKAYRDAGSPKYSLETFLEETYCGWEILPVTPDYTQSWIRGMQKNYKAHQINKALAFDFATALYVARGTMFTAMKAVDRLYTICTCPTPEVGGGCVLTNWYYYGLSNTSLLPSDDFNGRRRDERGNVLPCSVFPERGNRECMGCGCDHSNPKPRHIETVLQAADRIGESYGIKPL